MDEDGDVMAATNLPETEDENSEGHVSEEEEEDECRVCRGGEEEG